MGKVAESSLVAVWYQRPEESLSERQVNNRCRKYLELKSQIKNLESQISAIKSDMVALQNELLAYSRTGKYEINYTEFTQSRIDSKRLREELPDVAQEYSKKVNQWRFSVKEVKS